MISFGLFIWCVVNNHPIIAFWVVINAILHYRD
jgi:hypothetical protein